MTLFFYNFINLWFWQVEMLDLKKPKIGLELFEKYKNPIFSINFRVRQFKLKIAKVNLK